MWFLPKKLKDSVSQKLNSSIFREKHILFSKNITVHFNSPQMPYSVPPKRKKGHFRLPKRKSAFSRKLKYFNISKIRYFNLPKMIHFNLKKMTHFSLLRTAHFKLTKTELLYFPQNDIFQSPKIVPFNLSKLKHCSRSLEFPKQNIFQEMAPHTLEIHLRKVT